MAKKSFDVGRMRSLITFQTPGRPAKDPATGTVVTTWVFVDTVPAEVIAMNGNELAIARQVYSKVSYRITIRNDIDIDNKYRIIYPGFETGDNQATLSGRQIFEIEASFAEDPQEKFTRIMASEIKKD